MTHVLIVDDDGPIACDLAWMATRHTAVFCTCAQSIELAELRLSEAVDFVFLDIDVADGTSYDLARLLRAKKIAFVFTSGSSADDIPDDLKDVPFLGKPYKSNAIARAIIGGLAKYGRGTAAIN